MTNEDVIEYLASIWHYRAINRLALHIAIKALEKQTPKKILRIGYTCFCPSCGYDYLVKRKGKCFCPECGQHIDWSEEDDD